MAKKGKRRKARIVVNECAVETNNITFSEMVTIITLLAGIQSQESGEDDDGPTVTLGFTTELARAVEPDLSEFFEDDEEEGEV